MRSLLTLLFAGIVVLAAGCSAPPFIAPGASGPAADTAAPAQPGVDPVQTGKRLLEAGGRQWLETPVPVVVEQMTFAEAHKWIPMLSQEGDAVWGSQTLVWFVVFKGVWAPNDPASTNHEPVTSPGCLMVLFRASDGSLIAAGDSLCPGQQ